MYPDPESSIILSQYGIGKIRIREKHPGSTKVFWILVGPGFTCFLPPGSGSGYFFDQAKKFNKKTLIPTDIFWTFYLRKMVLTWRFRTCLLTTVMPHCSQVTGGLEGAFFAPAPFFSLCRFSEGHILKNNPDPNIFVIDQTKPNRFCLHITFWRYLHLNHLQKIKSSNKVTKM